MVIYISVPEFSYQKNVNGEELAGRVLARRFRDVMTEMGYKGLTVKWKVRQGERWTEGLQEEAEANMKHMIYRRKENGQKDY